MGVGVSTPPLISSSVSGPNWCRVVFLFSVFGSSSLSQFYFNSDFLQHDLLLELAAIKRRQEFRL